jgi:hypothetical protein
MWSPPPPPTTVREACDFWLSGCSKIVDTAIAGPVSDEGPEDYRPCRSRAATASRFYARSGMNNEDIGEMVRSKVTIDGAQILDFEDAA